jgi:CDP-glycerol glycerophosphotransferase (TagB/SpsB family)
MNARFYFLHYGFSLSNSYSKYWANDIFLRYCDFIFAEHKTKYLEYKKHLSLGRIAGLTEIFETGYPRLAFHTYENASTNNGSVRSFLWIPRWYTTGSNPDRSSFFELAPILIEYFEKNPMLSLVIRPHPNMESSLVGHDDKKDEWDRLNRQASSSSNITFDNVANFDESLKNADVLIADYSALIIDYFISGRPVIYFGRTSHLNSEAREIFKSFYHVNTPDDLMREIVNLLNSNDMKKGERKEAAKMLFDISRQANSKIIEHMRLKHE